MSLVHDDPLGVLARLPVLEEAKNSYPASRRGLYDPNKTATERRLARKKEKSSAGRSGFLTP